MENCKALISLAIHEGVEAEVFQLKRDLKSVRIYRNEIAEAQNIVEEGAGIRVVKDGSLGFSATNTLDHDSLEKAFWSALNMAKLSTKNSKWRGLPTEPVDPKESTLLDLYDKELASKSPDDIVELALNMSKEMASHDGSAETLTGVLMTLSEQLSILNSNGFEYQGEPCTLVFSRIIVEVKQNAEYSTAMKQFSSRKLGDFGAEQEVVEVANSATQMLRLPRRRVSKSKYEVILSPEAVGAITCYLMTPMITGRSVQQGVSCFSSMLYTKIAAESFSLTDNGRIKGGIGSATVDDEGNPTRLTNIIQDGILKGFLYDSLTASLSETSTTGNARRPSDTLGRTYLSPPEPLPTNLVIKGGDYHLGELVEETKEGILLNSIDYTFHLVPERGYFRITSSFPVPIITNGEIESYTQNIAVSDELVKALMKIDGIGKDLHQTAHLGSLAAFCPHMRIKDMAVAQGN